jgi:hypothetical protein
MVVKKQSQAIYIFNGVYRVSDAGGNNVQVILELLFMLTVSESDEGI